MKYNQLLKQIIFSIIVLFIADSLQAQVAYKLNNETSEIKVTGTSTIHDWHMMALSAESNFDALLSDDRNLTIQQVSFKIKSDAIKSDNSIMDNKAHDALKSEKFPFIQFKATPKLLVEKNLKSNPIILVGNITIAGETMNTSFPIEILHTDTGVEVSGEMKVLFSDFNLKAPTAMMGTIKTGNEVVVHFNLKYLRING